MRAYLEAIKAKIEAIQVDIRKNPENPSDPSARS
jgi:hypothetical protein